MKGYRVASVYFMIGSSFATWTTCRCLPGVPVCFWISMPFTVLGFSSTLHHAWMATRHGSVLRRHFDAAICQFDIKSAGGVCPCLIVPQNVVIHACKQSLTRCGLCMAYRVKSEPHPVLQMEGLCTEFGETFCMTSFGCFVRHDTHGFVPR